MICNLTSVDSCFLLDIFPDCTPSPLNFINLLQTFLGDLLYLYIKPKISVRYTLRELFNFIKASHKF